MVVVGCPRPPLGSPAHAGPPYRIACEVEPRNAQNRLSIRPALRHDDANENNDYYQQCEILIMLRQKKPERCAHFAMTASVQRVLQAEC